MSDFVYIALFTGALLVATVGIVLLFKGEAVKKVAIAMILTFAAMVNYRAFNVFKGQAKVLQVSHQGALVTGHLIDYKNKQIYLWLKITSQDAPITFQVPYDEKLAKRLQQLRGKFKGRPYRMDVEVKVDPKKPFESGTQINLVTPGEGISGLPPKGPLE